MRSTRVSSHAIVPALLVVLAVLTVSLAVAQAPGDSTATGMPAAVDTVAGAMTPAADVADVTDAGGGGVFSRVRNSYLGQMYARGGVVMHPLLACAVLAIILIIERTWTLTRARADSRNLMLEVVRALRQEGPAAALRACEGTRGPIAAILHSGLLRAHRGPEAVEKAIHNAGAIEMAFLERGLLALATISNIAPLLGFLGTVTGMISAFAAIAAAEQVSARLVAKGIEEALITTATGLIIAVPVSAFYSYFVLAIDRFVLEMEEASSELVDELMDIEYRRDGGKG